MPKIQKQFHLELTVEQFLAACSYLELQEVAMRLDAHLRRAERNDPAHRMTEIQEAFEQLSEPLKEVGIGEDMDGGQGLQRSSCECLMCGKSLQDVGVYCSDCHCDDR